VLVANHASYIDSFVLAAALPRPLGFVAKGELANHWSTRLPLSRLQAHFVERFDKEKSLDDARRIGQSAGGSRPLVFFAEGTFTRVPGLLPFHLGAFVTAVDHGVPVVPIAIRGTRSILRSGSWFPRRGTVTITIGKPIEPGEQKTDTPTDKWSAALRLRDLTREHILRHSGEPDLEHEKWPILRRPPEQ
jgi:1-acyl-sn-glycerol-3-phosphate acyltransferase